MKLDILAIGNCPLNPQLGSGKTRLRWASGLRELGHRVDVAQPSDFELAPWLKNGKRLRQAAGALSFVSRRLDAVDYDIVEFFGGEFGWVTRRLARRSRRPLLVAHTDGLELTAYYGPAATAEREKLDPLRSMVQRLQYKLDEAAFRFADRFVTGAALEQQFVVNAGLFESEHTEVIAPGLDSEFLGRPFVSGDHHHIAYLGTWSERKDPALIVEVLSELLRDRTNLVFNVFGAWGSRDRILEAFPAPVRSRVIVQQKLPVDSLADALSENATFFLPSAYEGFGMATAEAMGCGCAAVVTPTGFGGEIARLGIGHVCDHGDAPAMVRTLRKLLDEPVERIATARKGWEFVQSLTWENQTRKLAETYSAWIEALPPKLQMRKAEEEAD